MSGGSLDYAYAHVSDAASAIRTRRANSPLHMAFAAHLDLVAQALRDLEWVLSGDTVAGGEVGAIRAVVSHSEEIGAAIRQAERAQTALASAIDSARRAIEERGEK
jgi:hypothetical protein